MRYKTRGALGLGASQRPDCWPRSILQVSVWRNLHSRHASSAKVWEGGSTCRPDTVDLRLDIHTLPEHAALRPEAPQDAQVG